MKVFIGRNELVVIQKDTILNLAKVFHARVGQGGWMEGNSSCPCQSQPYWITSRILIASSESFTRRYMPPTWKPLFLPHTDINLFPTVKKVMENKERA
ncbi:MAG: hypothetical protein WC749_03775 [Dehalococcoidia bacterium]